MKKIKKLTSKQEEKLVRFRQEWFEVGSCTDPADRPKAEAAISKMYIRIKKKPPRFIWVQSPATALLCCGLLKKFTKESTDSLGDSLGVSLEDSLRDSLEVSLWNSLGVSLWNSLEVSLWNSLWNSLRDSLRDQEFRNAWWGQHDSFWIAFYRFAESVLGVRYERSAELHLWDEIARSCCWWWPFENICIVSDRPEILNWESREERSRLHCADGPALKFRDGWSVWSWHGLRVSRELIEHPEKITIKEIDKEKNAEIRRVMVERYGLDRFIQDSNAVVVDESKFGTLYHREMSNDEPIATVRVKDVSTGRIYFLRVPPNVKTAQEAIAWTFNLPENVEYKPVIET